MDNLRDDEYYPVWSKGWKSLRMIYMDVIISKVLSDGKLSE